MDQLLNTLHDSSLQLTKGKSSQVSERIEYVISYLYEYISYPVDDQGFSDTEQHNGDLSNREEAPNGGLLHQIGGYQASWIGAKREEEDSLYYHSFLLVEGKEWGKHEEGMDGSSWNHVGGVCHGNWPRKMIVS